MQYVLWFLLIFSSSEASLEETTRLNESWSSSELRSSEFALADAIYDKQKECDAIVGEAVVKVLGKGVCNKFPVPGERYIQCRNILDEKKREYINAALLGLPYYSTVFTMRLSNKRLVTLPVPAEEDLSNGAVPDFDIQQELCMTIKLCITLDNLKFSEDNIEDLNERKNSVSCCLAFLDDLKLKYIDLKKLDKSDLKKGDVLSLMCTDGAVTLTIPEKLKGVDFHTTSSSMASGELKIKPSTQNVDKNKDTSTTKPAEGIYRDPYNEVVKEINSIIEKNSKVIAENQGSDNAVPISKSGDKDHHSQENTENDISVKTETIPQEVDLSDIKTNDVTTETKGEISGNPESEVSSSDKLPEEGIARSEPREDDDPYQQEEILNTRKCKDIPKLKQGTVTKGSETIPTLGETEKSLNNEDGVTSEILESTNAKSEHKGPRKSKDGKPMELESYQVKVVTKNGERKVVEIEASGRIKKKERGNPSSNLQGFLSSNIGPKSDNGAKRISDLGLVGDPKKDNDAKRRRISNSLEENIVLMENDCKELLQFGEKLLQSKMLSSLINLENHYNDCIKRSDALKNMYIKKHQVDVRSHKNIFPLTLTFGDPKLVPLPAQFLTTGLVESQSSLNLTPGYEFYLGEFFRKNDQSENPTLNDREPFDDPAFISNDEFLEGLQQGAASPDSSTLSKVASILYLNGGHDDRNIAE